MIVSNFGTEKAKLEHINAKKGKIRAYIVLFYHSYALILPFCRPPYLQKDRYRVQVQVQVHMVRCGVDGVGGVMMG